MNQIDDKCFTQHRQPRKTNLNTLVRETAGNETPTKYPKTTPIIVVMISLALSFDFFKTPLQTRQKIHLRYSKQGEPSILALRSSYDCNAIILKKVQSI